MVVAVAPCLILSKIAAAKKKRKNDLVWLTNAIVRDGGIPAGVLRLEYGWVEVPGKTFWQNEKGELVIL